MCSPSGGTQCPFPDWSVLGNSSDRPNSKRFGLLSVVVLFFSQQLVGPAQCVWNIPKPGRCHSYHWLILSPFPSDSLEGSVAPAALSAPDQDTQPFPCWKWLGEAASNMSLLQHNVNISLSSARCSFGALVQRTVVLNNCNFVAFSAG